MNDLIDDMIEEAIMALRMAGAIIPRYNILEDGSVYFQFPKTDGSYGDKDELQGSQGDIQL